MKKLLGKIISILLCISSICLTLVGCKAEIEVKELGIPTQKQFSLGAMARCPWDLKVFEGKVYVGSGDYGLNTGPTVIWAYDINSGKFVSSGDVRDDAVASFKIIGGKLTAPGTDPMGGWSAGNFYQFNGSKWNTYSNIPNGIHNFDMVEFGGKIYAGLGVNVENSPVAVSSSVNDYFEFVPLYKNGVEVDATTMDLLQYRVYDLVVLNEDLYAMVCFASNSGSKLEVYKLIDGVFEYYSNADVLFSSNRVGTNLIDGKITYNGNAYFANGYLYSSSNLTNFNKINLPNGGCATDLLIDGDSLYILSYVKNGDNYKIYIYQTDGDVVQEVLSFEYGVTPISFDKSGDVYYLGMGDRRSKNEKNGMILSVKA